MLSRLSPLLSPSHHYHRPSPRYLPTLPSLQRLFISSPSLARLPFPLYRLFPISFAFPLRLLSPPASPAPSPFFVFGTPLVSLLKLVICDCQNYLPNGRDSRKPLLAPSSSASLSLSFKCLVSSSIFPSYLRLNIYLQEI